MKKKKTSAEITRARAWPRLLAPPTTVLADPKASAAALKIALALSSFDNRGAGHCFASAEALANRAQVTRRTVFRGLQYLRENGHTRKIWHEMNGHTIETELLIWTEAGAKIAQFGPVEAPKTDQIDHPKRTKSITKTNQIDHPKRTKSITGSEPNRSP